MRAILLVDHGSRRSEANAVVGEVADLVRAELGEGAIVEPAHMELAAPSIAEAFDACVGAGAAEVVVVPYFLAPGRHARDDVPRLVGEAAAKHPEVRWRVAEVLGADPLMARLVLRRAAGGGGPDRG